MELFFLAILILTMVAALGSGYPVAFALPGSAIFAIAAAGLCGLIFAGDSGAYFAQGNPIQWFNAGVTNFRGIYWEPERDTLIAIPLFIFMGIMLERSKIAEDLLLTMAQLFGPVPGGLGISVVVVGALLAATTGILGATVVAMGLISLPVMLRNGYSQSLATGTISASGTLGQIIPPSIVLIILADQLSNAIDQGATLRKAEYKLGTGSSSLPAEFGLTSASAGDMFLGAFLPGLVLVGLYILYILVLALIRPKVAPAVPHEGEFNVKFWGRVFVVLVPPLTLIVAVLGSIILGIATVNQAGAIGAAGALIMAGYRLKEGQKRAFVPAIIAIFALAMIIVLINTYELNVKNIKTTEDVTGIALAGVAVFLLSFALAWSGYRAFKIDKTLHWVMTETAKTTSLVFIILLGAAMLTAAFRAFGGEELVRHFLSGLPGGFYGKFIVVMAVIFLLGFFLDFIEIAVVVVPIIAPILLADPSANITAVWLGVMIGVNMQTSFLTPPFGFALFYLRGVAPPEVRTLQIYKGVIPFITLQLLGLAIVGFYPSLVNYLPNRVYLTSETAPPPQNPRLQLCIEENLFQRYDADAAKISADIDTASKLDVSALPAELQTKLTESFASARKTFGLIEDVRKTSAAYQANVASYRPLHREVRETQRFMQRIDKQIKELETTRRRASGNSDAGNDQIKRLEEQIAALKAQKAELEAEIPADWKDARKRHVDLEKAEKKARTLYRRNVDDAYEPIKEIRTLVGATEQLVALDGELRGLGAVISGEEPVKAMDTIKAFEKKLSAVPGTSKIKSKLSKTRRALKGASPKRDVARTELNDAISLFSTEVDWRKRAASGLSEGLETYNDGIKDTLGLRLQTRLPKELATDVAACLSHHRDISLSF